MELLPEFEAGQLTDAGTRLRNWGPSLRRLEIARQWARSPVLDVDVDVDVGAGGSP